MRSAVSTHPRQTSSPREFDGLSSLPPRSRDPAIDYETFDLGDVALQSGQTLRGARLAYKTYGALNAKRDNIIYPCFSTSPSNTGAPYNGARFPKVTAYDNIVQLHRLIVEKFGIERIKLATGWSMGALQSYHWAALFPDMVERILPFQGSAKCSTRNFVALEGVRATLELDPHFSDGLYSCVSPSVSSAPAGASVSAGRTSRASITISPGTAGSPWFRTRMRRVRAFKTWTSNVAAATRPTCELAKHRPFADRPLFFVKRHFTGFNFLADPHATHTRHDRGRNGGACCSARNPQAIRPVAIDAMRDQHHPQAGCKVA